MKFEIVGRKRAYPRRDNWKAPHKPIRSSWKGDLIVSSRTRKFIVISTRVEWRGGNYVYED